LGAGEGRWKGLGHVESVLLFGCHGYLREVFMCGFREMLVKYGDMVRGVVEAEA